MDSEDLPAHIGETVDQIARLHASHRTGATPVEKGVARVTQLFSTSRAAGFVLLFVLAWMGGNLALAALRAPPFDPPPFGWLQALVSLAALLMTIFILITQRREDELSDLRAQLILELVIQAEQKSAKTIELLESLRVDLPGVRDRHDPEAHELAKRAEPEAVLQALKDVTPDNGEDVMG